jgi:IclR family pca regulon transcriptional regulator
MTLREVALSAGVSRAAARRSLITLVGLGYVGETPDGYEIRPRVFEFGYAYLGRQPLTAVTTPHLVDLVARIDEFASVAVLDDGHIVHIVRETPARRLITVDINVGSRFPAFATAQGRMLLAGLPSQEWQFEANRVALTRFTPHTVESVVELTRRVEVVRRTGYALNDQEMTNGIRSIAVPILDDNGATVAALGSIVNAASWTLKAIRTGLVPELRQTAERISKDLRGAPIRRNGRPSGVKR